MDEHHSWYNGSVWHIDWPYQVYVHVGQLPIFYGWEILLHILKTISWRNIVFGIMDQCDSKIDLVKYMWVSDLFSMVHWFYFISLSDLFLWNGAVRGYSCPSGYLSSFYLFLISSVTYCFSFLLFPISLCFFFGAAPMCPCSNVLVSGLSAVSIDRQMDRQTEFSLGFWLEVLLYFSIKTL